MLLLMLVTTFSFAACSDDDDENGSGLVITNSSTYTLQRFRVVFITAQGETLSDREYGTFYPGEKQEIPLPVSPLTLFAAPCSIHSAKS